MFCSFRNKVFYLVKLPLQSTIKVGAIADAVANGGFTGQMLGFI